MSKKTKKWLGIFGCVVLALIVLSVIMPDDEKLDEELANLEADLEKNIESMLQDLDIPPEPESVKAESKDPIPLKDGIPELECMITNMSDLYLTYSSNELLGDSKFKGKMVLITDMMTHIIKRTLKGQAYIRYPMGQYESEGVVCIFDKKMEYQLTSNLDHRVYILGLGAGKDLEGNVALKHCKILDKEKAKEYVRSKIPVVQVSQVDLWADYVRDEYSADSKYRNVREDPKLVKIADFTVGTVERDGRGDAYLQYLCQEQKGFKCFFDKSEEYQLTALNDPHLIVTIMGMCRGTDAPGGNVIIVSCRIVGEEE